MTRAQKHWQFNLKKYEWWDGIGTLRFMTFNTYEGLGDPDGTAAEQTKFTAIKEIINRVRPDYLNINEVGQESSNSIINRMLAETSLIYYRRGVLGLFGNAAASKYPLGAATILTSTPPADEFPENVGFFKNLLTVNSSNILVYNIHNEPWCDSPPCTLDTRPHLEFPRAIQHIRLKEDIESEQASNPSYKIIVMGDHNDDNQSGVQTDSFSEEPAGIRGSFVLGSDITFPVDYGIFPDDAYSSFNFTLLEGTDVGGNRNTINANEPNPNLTFELRLDYIALGSGVVNKGVEIVNSVNDANSGLPKYGSVLNSDRSKEASDHRPVFADLSFPGFNINEGFDKDVGLLFEDTTLYTFNGVDDVQSFAFSGLNVNDIWCVSFDVKATEVGRATNGTMLHLTDGSNNRVFTISLFDTQGDVMHVQRSSGVIGNDANVSNTPILVNTLYKVTVINDNYFNPRIWFGGTEVTTSTSFGFGENDQADVLYLGARKDNLFFKGTIQNVRIWDRIKTQNGEIAGSIV